LNFNYLPRHHFHVAVDAFGTDCVANFQTEIVGQLFDEDDQRTILHFAALNLEPVDYRLGNIEAFSELLLAFADGVPDPLHHVARELCFFGAHIRLLPTARADLMASADVTAQIVSKKYNSYSYMSIHIVSLFLVMVSA
jgi:hypothetical protein